MCNFFRNVCLLLFLVGCTAKVKDQKKDIKENPLENSNENKGQQILADAITTHGGKAYDVAHFQFIFRDKQYTFNNQNGTIYTVLSKDSIGNILNDSLVNGKFERYINGNLMPLSEKDISKYSQALNSVIYFATLPHKLSDKAVKAKYLEKTIIGNEKYDAVEVTFGKNGGGNDYDDVFCYWVNQNTKTIDFLAYRYQTNNGGVRFRSAYDPKMVDGIRFQDYINWKAPLGTSLIKLPFLYENGELEELSRIETEAVQNLNPKPIQD